MAGYRAAARTPTSLDCNLGRALQVRAPTAQPRQVRLLAPVGLRARGTTRKHFVCLAPDLNLTTGYALVAVRSVVGAAVHLGLGSRSANAQSTGRDQQAADVTVDRILDHAFCIGSAERFANRQNRANVCFRPKGDIRAIAARLARVARHLSVTSTVQLIQIAERKRKISLTKIHVDAEQ